MNFADAVTVAGTRRRDDGYLVVADARIARSGIQTDLVRCGKPDMSVVRVYRAGAEVFVEDTLKSAAHRPVRNEHPPEMVPADNWKNYAIGQTGDEVTGEGIVISVPLEYPTSASTDIADIVALATGRDEDRGAALAVPVPDPVGRARSLGPVSRLTREPDDVIFGCVGEGEGHLSPSKALWVQRFDQFKHGSIDDLPAVHAYRLRSTYKV